MEKRMDMFNFQIVCTHFPVLSDIEHIFKQGKIIRCAMLWNEWDILMALFRVLRVF